MRLVHSAGLIEVGGENVDPNLLGMSVMKLAGWVWAVVMAVCLDFASGRCGEYLSNDRSAMGKAAMMMTNLLRTFHVLNVTRMICLFFLFAVPTLSKR